MNSEEVQLASVMCWEDGTAKMIHMCFLRTRFAEPIEVTLDRIGIPYLAALGGDIGPYQGDRFPVPV
ncbi:hypothetical protein FRB91_007053 [Serendipita sp. 411]|nr:hypothetical protein FRC18_001088 [Serendipita sp. 400]KAG8839326.1 hypothetical protein FRB91_007053 [Serendipita sp. 411]